MSFFGLITHWLPATILFALGVTAAVFAWLSFNSLGEPVAYGRRSRRANWIRVCTMATLTVLCFVLSLWGFTHTVIGVNTKAIVVDKTRGQVIGTMRSSGLTSKPMFATVVEFPGAVNAPVCIDFTPSVKGGYGVKLNTCFFINGNKVDWLSQFTRYNPKDFEALKSTWQSALSPLVAGKVKDYAPDQLTSERAAVANDIKNATSDWFASEQISVTLISLANWDFTNPEVGKIYDSAIAAQAQRSVSEASLDAVETQIQVMKSLADGQVATMESLGLMSEDARVKWLTLQYLANLRQAPSAVILDTSGNAVPAIPALQAPAVTAPVSATTVVTP